MKRKFHSKESSDPQKRNQPQTTAEDDSDHEYDECMHLCTNLKSRYDPPPHYRIIGNPSFVPFNFNRTPPTPEELEHLRSLKQGTPEWLAARRIGSSQMHEFLGITKAPMFENLRGWMDCSPAYVSTSVYAALGHVFEDKNVEYFLEIMRSHFGVPEGGVSAEELGVMVNMKNPFESTSLDRNLLGEHIFQITVGGDEISFPFKKSVLECKCTLKEYEELFDPRYMIQTQRQIAVSNTQADPVMRDKEWAFLSALHIPYDVKSKLEEDPENGVRASIAIHANRPWVMTILLVRRNADFSRWSGNRIKRFLRAFHDERVFTYPAETGAKGAIYPPPPEVPYYFLGRYDCGSLEERMTVYPGDRNGEADESRPPPPLPPKMVPRRLADKPMRKIFLNIANPDRNLH